MAETDQRSDDGHEPHPDDSRDDQPTSGLKKKRIQQACRPCGIKRVKCDGSKPCITCVRSGEVCEYGQPKKRGPPKGSTRGGSKAAKRKAQAQARDATFPAATSLPMQTTRDYAAAAASASAPLTEPESSHTAVSAQSGKPSRFPFVHQGPSHPAYHHPHALPPTYVSDLRQEPASASRHASPDGSYRTESHRTTADGSIGSPNYGANAPSPGSYYPSYSYPSRYEPSSSSHASKPRSETFYRGSSSGLGFIRPPPGTADRKLPPLDFYSRSSARSPSSPSNYGRLSITSDTFESAFSGRSGPNRSLHKTTAPYAKPSPSVTVPTLPSSSAAAHLPGRSAELSRYDTHPTSIAPLGTASTETSGTGAWSTAQNAVPARADTAATYKARIHQPAAIRHAHAGDSNQILVEGALLQMQQDRDREQKRKASSSSIATGLSQTSPDDINLEPLLWVEPSDENRFGVKRFSVSLTKPEIPPLIQERLFTIFWGIVQTIWPALYKPALCLTEFNVVDPEKHPMLHNACCALAAVAWDSGEFGISEEDTEATQSDWVERTASDLTFSQAPVQLGDGTSLRRLSAADLGDIFLARAKYYLVKTNNEPSLEAIQSLLFLALREGGNGRASQASAYISTACRMCIDLGMHRQRDFSSVLGLHFSHAEEQARRRIFWCLYLLDKTSSASLGRPVMLRYAEIDCPLPNVDEADEHETWAETTNNSSLIKDRARSMLMKTPVAAMTHLRFGVRLGHLCERVIAMYTQVRRPDEDEEVGSSADGKVEDEIPEWETRLIKLNRSLDAWERDLPYRLRFEEPSHCLPNTLSQNLWFQACRVMLHRPYILKRSSRSDLPPSHRICTDAVGTICEILTAYDNNFGMRKLSSTFTYCIFTASTIEIANTTSTNAATAVEAKRRLKKFMTWLSRMSGTWQSASHHLKILEQLGHGIDADLDGTGLPSKNVSRAHSPTGITAEATATTAVPGLADSAEEATMLPGVAEAQHKAARQEDIDGGSAAVVAMQPTLVGADDPTSLSVPGPIGAPMYLTKSRTSFQLAPAQQDDLQAQFQAQGQNPGQLFGWPALSNVASRAATPGASGGFDTTPALPVAATGTAAMTAPADASETTTTTQAGPALIGGQVNPTAYLKLHDTSYWGAMPLSSEDALSWANFTSSYIEALNGMSAAAVTNGANILPNAATTTAATATFPPQDAGSGAAANPVAASTATTNPAQ